MSLRKTSSFIKSIFISSLCGLMVLGNPLMTLANSRRLALSVEAVSVAERSMTRGLREKAARLPLADTVNGVQISKVDDGGKSALLATIQLNGQAKYSYFTLTNPHRLVIDVKNVGRVKAPAVTPVNESSLDRVRVGKYANAIRVVFDTRSEPSFRVKRELDRLLVWLDNSAGSPSVNSGKAEPQVKAPSAKATDKKPEVTGIHLTVTPNKSATDKPATVPASGNADSAKTAPQPKVTATPLATPPAQAVAANGAGTKNLSKTTDKPTPVASPTPVATPKPTPAATPVVSALAKPTVTTTPAPVVAKPTPSASPIATAPKATPTPMPVSLPTPAAKVATPSPAPAAAINTANVSSNSSKPVATAPASVVAKPTPQPTPQVAAAPVNVPANQPVNKPAPAATKSDAVAVPPRDVVQPQRSVSQPPRRGFNPADYARQDFVGEPIKLDLKAVDIREVLRFISDTYKVNFVVDKSVPAETLVTVSLEDVPWNQALDALLKSNRIGVKAEGHIMRVMSVEAMAEEENQRRTAELARQQATPLVTEMIRLNYARAMSGGGSSGGSGGGSSGGAAGATGGVSAGAAGTGNQSGLDGVIRSRLSPRGSIQPDPRTNTLVITDIPENIAIIKDMIAKLDVPEPQVEIESRIVIANRSFARDLGVQLGAVALDTSRGGVYSAGTLPNVPSPNIPTNPGAGTGSSSSGGLFGVLDDALRAAKATSGIGLTTGLLGTAQISAILTAQESKGNAKTISSPRITAQNNQTANIVNGVQIPVQTESNNTVTVTYVTAALRLEITPQITDTGNVVLRVVAENNSVNLDDAVRTNAAPGINTQRAETTVLVPDGGTTIIGGINVDVESNSQNRTPGVSRIPGLGELFKRRTVNHSTGEILFFITPRIYRPMGVPPVAGPMAPPASK